MDEAAIIQYIADTFDDSQVETADGNSFFFYGSDRKMPFATLVNEDDYDQVSNLNRPSVYRLNIGLSKPAYLALFGVPPPAPGADGVIDTGHDFTALDQVMPHPVYGHMFWVCVLNPSDTTFQTVRPMLAEAYELAVRRHRKAQT